MTIKRYISFIIFGVQYFSAQEIIKKIDSVNGHIYSIEMDVRIDDLLEKTENNCMQSSIKNGDNNKRKEIVNRLISKKKLTTKTNYTTLSIADICKEKPKLMGYKIQIATTNNGNDANKIRHDIRNNFPALRAEIDSSLRPNYKILAGSFFSKKSGNNDLKQVKKIYNDAILIPYRIFCVEAK